MKSINTFAAIMTALISTVLLSCSKDELSDIKPTTAKKVTKMTETLIFNNSERVSLDTHFTYDSEGRVIKADQSTEGNVDFDEYTYTEDTIFIKRNNNNIVTNAIIVIENGRAIKTTEKSDGYSEVNELLYDGNGYLIKSTNKTIFEKEGEDSDVFITKTERTITDGNVTRRSQNITYNSNQEHFAHEYEASSHANNMNIDLASLRIFGNENADIYYTNSAGKNTKNLPSKATLTDSSEAESSKTPINFTYEFEGENLTKISTDETNGMAIEYAFEYEK